MVGDSLTFGNGSLCFDGRGGEELKSKPYMLERGSIPLEFRRLLEQKYAPRSVEVVMFARGGIAAMTRSHLVAQDCSHMRLRTRLSSCSFQEAPEFEAARNYSHQADLTVLMLGTNDAKNNASVLKTRNAFGGDLRAIVKGLHGAGTPGVFALVDPPLTDRPWKYKPESLDVVQREVTRIAADLGTVHVSLRSTIPRERKELLTDKVHFTPLACSLAAKAIFDAVDPLLPPAA